MIAEVPGIKRATAWRSHLHPKGFSLCPSTRSRDTGGASRRLQAACWHFKREKVVTVEFHQSTSPQKRSLFIPKVLPWHTACLGCHLRNKVQPTGFLPSLLAVTFIRLSPTHRYFPELFLLIRHPRATHLPTKM